MLFTPVPETGVNRSFGLMGPILRFNFRKFAIFVFCMRFLRHIAAVAAIMLSLPLSAQWGGSVDLSGGFGYMPQRTEDDFSLLHSLGKLGFNLHYNAPKIKWNTSLGGGFENRETDFMRLSVSGWDGESTGLVDQTFKFNRVLPISANFRTGVLWTPTAAQSYDAWVEYKINAEDGSGVTFKDNHVSQGDKTESSSQLYVETPLQGQQKLLGGIRTIHQLGSPSLVLKGEFILEGGFRTKENQWLVANGSDMDKQGYRSYRVNPVTETTTISASLHLADSIITSGPCRLLLDPGVRFNSEYTDDKNSGATWDPVAEVWRDSVRLKENFYFLAMKVEPYLAGEFSWKGVKARFDYSPQLYARRLTDDEHHQNLKLQRPYVVGKGSIGWQINPMHKVSFLNEITVRHPEYLQICWFERQGNFLTQVYRGKESLLSTQTTTFKLEYELKYKRFLSTTTLSYWTRTNEIDQTFTHETVDGREYQVFTWLNAADSRNSGITEVLGWRGRMLKANLGVTYNGTLRQGRETGTVKRTTDWRLWADAALTLPKGWTINANVNYRSNVETFFTIFSQYCALGAKISKSFKRVDIFLEGRDLLDNETSAEFISADETSGWIEVSRLNRRLVLLGLQWRFGR